MKLTSPSDVRHMLDQAGIRPSKALGQNFLIDFNIRRIILETARISGADIVLEVGPGMGVLTELLLEQARQVIAVEKDKRLAGLLQERFGADPAFKLICSDMLKVDVDELLAAGVTRVVSNLPYAAGTRILVELIQAAQPPDEITVTVQLEVAARLCARPGTKDYGMVSVWAQDRYVVDLIRTVSPTCFWPRPAVQSAIVSLRRRDDVLDDRQRRALFAVTKHAFALRRKQMVNIIGRLPEPWRKAAGDAEGLLEMVDIPSKARPEDVDVEHWQRLAIELTGRQ